MTISFILRGTIIVYIKKMESDINLEASLIIVYKISSIIKVFYIISFILHRVIFFGFNPIFEATVFFFAQTIFAGESFYLKKLQDIGIILHKNCWLLEKI